MGKSVYLILLTALAANPAFSNIEECFRTAANRASRDSRDRRFLAPSHLDPASKEFQIFKSEVLAIQSFEELPALPLDQISNVSEITDGVGKGFLRIEKCNLPDGTLVFRKTSSAQHQANRQRSVKNAREPEDVINEAKWLIILNKIGLGPKFRGVQILGDGHYAIITDFVEGKHVLASTIIQSITTKYNVDPNAISDIRRTGQILKDAMIYPKDLQFRITDAGRHAVVVDPEKFYDLGYTSPKSAEDANHLARILEEMNQRKQINSPR